MKTGKNQLRIGFGMIIIAIFMFAFTDSMKAQTGKDQQGQPDKQGQYGQDGQQDQQQQRQQGQQGQPGTTGTQDMGMNTQNFNDIITSWPDGPQRVARDMMQKYGNPDEVTGSMAVWHNKGMWKHTIVYKEETRHNFPMTHTDYLEQVVDYKTPVDKCDDIVMYDGSIIIERTKGELSARCDREEMNILALNLANDIATGKRTVNEARDFYAKTAAAFKKGDLQPYVQKLQFTIAKGTTADPDKSVSGDMMKKDQKTELLENQK